METTINISIILGAVFSLLFSLIAYFLRQIHSDFRKVEQSVSEIKISIELIKSNTRSLALRLGQQIHFLEKRVDHLENYSTKHYEHEKGA